MTLTIITSNERTAGTTRQATTSDADFEVAPEVLVESTTSTAFVLTASNHDVTVRGTVLEVGGIVLGDSGTDSGLQLLVAGTGLVAATQGNGVQMAGSGRIDNAGTILATVAGVVLLSDSTGSSLVRNTGQITGGFYGIYALGSGGREMRVINDGTVNGGEIGSFVSAGDTTDTVLNRGVMVGSVMLGLGDDIFDNSLGVLRDGTINGGGGDDSFAPGRGAEVFDGSLDTDTLDFRTGGGLTVSLSDRTQNTGRAAGDQYLAVERVLGGRRRGTTGWWAKGGPTRLRGPGGTTRSWGSRATTGCGAGTARTCSLAGTGRTSWPGGTARTCWAAGRASTGWPGARGSTS